MSNKQLIEIIMPKYPIGSRVLALINNQLRQVVIEEAYLDSHIVVNETGAFFDGELRWEYRVLVLNKPLSGSEQMIIIEQTILRELNSSED